MIKSKVLLIRAGGTITMKSGANGSLVPGDFDFLKTVPDVNGLADITVVDAFNIDSTNMKTSHRAILAKIIFDAYQDYDGFVITHGTDTMPETACALNYMVQHLGKPIVLTGSQKYISAPDSDAPHNLFCAIKAATMDIGEIVIVFGNNVVRGSRAIKYSEHGLNAFTSPKVSLIGEIGIDLMISDQVIRRYRGDPILFTDFDSEIEVYFQSAGASARNFEKYVKDKDVHGVLIIGYGAGNVQDDLIEHIAYATKKGKPVLVATKCIVGAADMGLYATGIAPLKAGAISAGDLTIEAAMQKLMYALGRANKMAYSGAKRLEFIRNIIHKDYNKDIATSTNRFSKSH